MSALLIVLLEVLIAALPLVLAWFFLRKKYRPSLRVFPAAAGAGLFAVLIAAAAQLAIAPLAPEPSIRFGARLSILYKLFLEIAFTEELARLGMILAASRLLRGFFEKHSANKKALMRTLGMLTGFSFAAIETIFFMMTNTGSGLIRAISAAPLHGACGIRAGSAALSIKEKPGLSIITLLLVSALHGVYNFLAQRGGVFIFIGMALALSALFSGVQSITFEDEGAQNNGVIL